MVFIIYLKNKIFCGLFCQMRKIAKLHVVHMKLPVKVLLSGKIHIDNCNLHKISYKMVPRLTDFDFVFCF